VWALQRDKYFLAIQLTVLGVLPGHVPYHPAAICGQQKWHVGGKKPATQAGDQLAERICLNERNYFVFVRYLKMRWYIHTLSLGQKVNGSSGEPGY
jgi:hypothetical protein